VSWWRRRPLNNLFIYLILPRFLNLAYVPDGADRSGKAALDTGNRAVKKDSIPRLCRLNQPAQVLYCRFPNTSVSKNKDVAFRSSGVLLRAAI
jgi:hypothetical protein